MAFIHVWVVHDTPTGRPEPEYLVVDAISKHLRPLLDRRSEDLAESSKRVLNNDELEVRKFNEVRHVDRGKKVVDAFPTGDVLEADVNLSGCEDGVDDFLDELLMSDGLVE